MRRDSQFKFKIATSTDSFIQKSLTSKSLQQSLARKSALCVPLQPAITQAATGFKFTMQRPRQNLKLPANLKFYRRAAVKFHAGKISKIIKFQEIL